MDSLKYKQSMESNNLNQNKNSIQKPGSKNLLYQRMAPSSNPSDLQLAAQQKSDDPFNFNSIGTNSKKPITSSEMFNAFKANQTKEQIPPAFKKDQLSLLYSKQKEKSESSSGAKQSEEKSDGSKKSLLFQNQFKGGMKNSSALDQDSLQAQTSNQYKSHALAQNIQQFFNQPPISNLHSKPKEFVPDESDGSHSSQQVDQEEQMMTEQDFDGHQNQSCSDNESQEQFEQFENMVKQEVGESGSEREEEELQQEEGDNQDQEEENGDDEQLDGQSKEGLDDEQQEEEQEEDDGEEEEEEEEEEDDDLDREDHNDNSQEGNIPISSQSISPEKQMQNLNYREEDIQDEYGDEIFNEQEDEEESEVRDSNLRSSGSPIMTMKTTQQEQTNTTSSISTFNEKKEVIVERNEKFIIYKMVPQLNRIELKSSQASNPASTQQDRGKPQEVKEYSETVEDIEASFSSDDQKQKVYVKDGKIQTRGDESFCDEEEKVKNEIKAMKNNFINSSFNLMKPPVVKKETEEKSLIDLDNITRIIQVNRASSLKQHQPDQPNNQSRDSHAQFSRSSSDRFSKLQKLEKKTISDEALEGAEFTLNKNLQNFTNILGESNNTEQIKTLPSTQQPFERRQSDSVVVRTSLLKDSQIELGGQQDSFFNQAVSQKEGKNTGGKEVGVSGKGNQSKGGTKKKDGGKQKKTQETEFLKQEYLKLKNQLDLLKKDPAPQQTLPPQSIPIKAPLQKAQPPKPVKSVEPKSIQPEQKTNIISKRNLVLENLDHSQEVSTNKFEGEQQLKEQSFLTHSEESDDNEVAQVKLHRKSMTPSSIDKKQVMKQRALYSQKESAKAADRDKIALLNERMRLEIQNKTKLTKLANLNKSSHQSKIKSSQRTSPQRNISKTHRNTYKNPKHQPLKNPKIAKTHDSLLSESDSQSSHSKRRINTTKHKSGHRKTSHQVQQHKSQKSKKQQNYSDSYSSESDDSHHHHHHHHHRSQSCESYYSEDEDEDEEEDHSCEYSDSDEYQEDSQSSSSQSDKSRYYRQIKKNSGTNQFHMHYKSKRGERKERKFKLKIKNNESQIMMASDKIMIDLTVKQCKDGSQKKKCSCSGQQHICMQVFYQVQEIMNVLKIYSGKLPNFELINIQSDRKKVSMTCSKELPKMTAIFNSSSQYLICISQNIDCITPLANYHLASGYLLQQNQLASSNPLAMNVPMGMMYQNTQMANPMFQQVQPVINQLYLQQQQQIQQNALNALNQQQQQQQLQQMEQSKHGMIFFGGLGNQSNQMNQSSMNTSSMMNNPPQFGKKDIIEQQSTNDLSIRQMNRNLSQKSLNNQYQHLNQQINSQYISQNPSPPRNFAIQREPLHFSRSPKDRDYSQTHRTQYDSFNPNSNSTSNNNNNNSQYLNQLKNRFLQKNQDNQEDLDVPSSGRNQGYTNSNSYRDNQHDPSSQKYSPQYSQQNNDSHYQKDRKPQQQQHTKTNSLMEYSSINERNFANIGSQEQQKYQNQRNTFNYQEEEQYAYEQSRGAKDYTNQSPDFNKVLEKKNSRAQTPSQDKDSCENESMDEGVKASATRQSALMSPKNIEFKSMIQKHANVSKKQYLDTGYRSPQNLSSSKKFQNQLKPSDHNPLIDNLLVNKQGSAGTQDLSAQDQDKKGPQALWIGFNEAESKNPFANRPQLNKKPVNNEVVARQQDQSQTHKTQLINNRSKSVKNGVQSAAQKSQKQTAVQQVKSPKGETGQVNIPMGNKPQRGKKEEGFGVNESPLKRAVADIKVKENIQQRTSKAELINISPRRVSLKQKVVNELDNDPSDPFHNKGLAIEIFDKKKGPTKKQEEVSLADMFKQKKKDIVEKLDHKKPQQDQDIFNQEEIQKDDKAEKKGKSKEELAELRKKMMKSKLKTKQDNFGGATAFQEGGVNNPGGEQGKNGKKGASKEPIGLMQRLATGQKPSIDKKEMKKLTSKNYSNLPEIQKKKEEEKKKEELMARKAHAVEYAKQMEEKRRKQIQFKKKRSIVGEEKDL